MMWSSCLLLALLQAVSQPPVPPTASTQPQPAVEPGPDYTAGPLRSDVFAMFDARYWYAEPRPGAREPELRIHLRFAGEGLENTARVGTVIFSEAVDDTGQSLIGPETYTEEQRTETRPFNAQPERVRANGLLLGSRLASPNRAARALKLRGAVRLVLAPQKEEITIDNPLQFLGRAIEHERLKQLGLEIRVVPVDDVEGEALPPADRMLVLQYVGCEERVFGVSLHDAWMKPLRQRERRLETKGGAVVVAYMIADGSIDEKCQLVLKVLPEVQDVRIPIEIDALPLP